MRWIKQTLRSSALVLALVTGLGTSPARAVDWLVLLVDRSNSIDSRELMLQRGAYVRLLSDPEVIRALDNAMVAIVEFDTRPEIIVEWTDAASAAEIYSHKPALGLRGQTGIGHAITSALSLLVGKSGQMVIDVSGDGRENVDSRVLARARAAATERAIQINGLAILNDDVPNLDAYYSRDVVTGFVLPVEGRDDFYRALRRKLFFEVAQRIPEGLGAAR
jgi:Protein of unknown function (DUF1194)